MNDAQRICALLFAIAASAIVAAAAATALALPDSTLARSIFLLLCHGREERAFVLGGEAMPICARCVGIYAGLIVGCLSIPVAAARRWYPEKGSVLMALMPLALDGTTQALGLRESNNTLRFATGIVAAFFFVVWAIGQMGERSESAHQKVA